MASDLTFVEFVLDQIDEDCGATAKSMFGEYGLFSEGKMFGLICDNRFMVKATEEGRAYIVDVVEAEPYPGAKPAFLVGDRMEDRAWVSELVRITTRALPLPKKRKPRKKKG